MLLALLLTLAVLAGTGFTRTLADGAPSVTLYSPAANSENAAISANQKIIFSANKSVKAAGGKVTVSDGTTAYTASASQATILGGDVGPWYLVFDLGAFKNGGEPLALVNDKTYTVSLEAGAFADASNGNACAAASASFRTVAADAVSEPVAVVYTGVGSASVASGQAVAKGTEVRFTLPSAGAYTYERSVRINGVSADISLGGHVLAGDLEVYVSRKPSAWPEGAAVEISGMSGASPTIGETLSGAITGVSESGGAAWTFAWMRGDTLVASGGSDKTYTLTADDFDRTITLKVTSADRAGELSSPPTGAVQKKAYVGAAVPAPVVQAIDAASVTLETIPGHEAEYEYSRGGEAWQESNVFTGLESGTSYDFYQRVKATDTVEASPASAKRTATTASSALAGTVAIAGEARFGQKLTASLVDGNSAALHYTWKRGGAIVATGAEYTPQSADIGAALTVEVTSDDLAGVLTGTSAAIGKALQGAPAAPTLAYASANSITLVSIGGYEYSLGGASWQEAPVFNNLAAGAGYSFYQRVKETSSALASEKSPAATFSTLPGLTGTITTSGEARYGMTLTANLTNTNNTGTLGYTWKRDGVTVGSGTAYAVTAADIGGQLSLEVTSSAQGGSITRAFGMVAKAYYTGSAPAAPTRYSRSSSKVVLNSVSGAEYSRDGSKWQDSQTFSSLKAETTYSFYQRYKATSTVEASPKSEALRVTTTAAESSNTPTPKPDDDDDAAPTPAGSSALFSYTLTSDNTRLLYSTMKSLAEGNKTQDVTIKQSGAEITFAKGSMASTYSQLWYDFGIAINGCIHEQTAKALGGDRYVATIHFNYEGTLPGKATVRFSLGAAHAGKTLSYYRLEDNNTLTFLQTTVADNSGWAAVVQESASDYVFLSGENAPAGTPTPSASPSVSPSPSPSPEGANVPTDSGSLFSDGWFVAGIILFAVALIIGGIWLYVRNRDSY